MTPGVCTICRGKLTFFLMILLGAVESVTYNMEDFSYEEIFYISPKDPVTLLGGIHWWRSIPDDSEMTFRTENPEHFIKVESTLINIKDCSVILDIKYGNSNERYNCTNANQLGPVEIKTNSRTVTIKLTKSVPVENYKLIITLEALDNKSYDIAGSTNNRKYEKKKTVFWIVGGVFAVLIAVATLVAFLVHVIRYRKKTNLKYRAVKNRAISLDKINLM